MTKSPQTRFNELVDEHLLNDNETKVLAIISEVCRKMGIAWEDAPGFFRRSASLIEQAQKEKLAD